MVMMPHGDLMANDFELGATNTSNPLLDNADTGKREEVPEKNCMDEDELWKD
jgi:hypothetical protein